MSVRLVYKFIISLLLLESVTVKLFYGDGIKRFQPIKSSTRWSWETVLFLVPRPHRLKGTDGSGDKYIQEFQHGGCSWVKEPLGLEFIAFYKENTTFRNNRIEQYTPKILQMCFDVLICTRFSFAF